ncbi:MAG: phage holin [Clostridiales bacterium]|nr:phage holin [Clostridiales bacterium]
MNINWKVRVQSGPFWLGIASAIIMAVFYILDLCGVVTNVTASQIIEVVQLLLLIPASIGIISDPTTKGVQDSKLALTYDKPKADGKAE